MTDWPLLSTIIFLPLIGAAFILLVRGDEQTVARNARNVALWTSVITFLLSLLLWFGFDTTTADFQFVEKAVWFPGFNINYHLGIDGISLFFVLLTTLLIPLCVLASWESIKVPGEGVHDRVPGHGNAGHRLVLRTGFRALLPVL